MHDSRSRRQTLAMVAALTGLSLFPMPAAAQIPDEFTNLQLLPKDISKRELVDTMRGWASALGVRCAHCHVGPDDLEGMDFASDERTAKRETREMVVLTRAINDDFLDAEEGQGVTCYTCHHNMPDPPRSINQELAGAAKRRGVAGAIARFRELHEWYYGTGRYDLSAGGLVGVAEEFLAAGQGDDALQLLAFGLELYPESADIHAGYGHAYVALEQPDLAREHFEKALEIDRRNRSARRGLRGLQGGGEQ